MLSFSQYLQEAEKKFDTSTFEGVNAWATFQIKMGRITYDTQYEVSTEPPYAISASLVRFNELKTLFKEKLPVHFGYVERFSARDCPKLDDFSKLNLAKVGDLDVTRSRITSFENCPIVTTMLYAYQIPLKTLQGAGKSLNDLKLLNISNSPLPELDAEFRNVDHLNISYMQNLSHLKNINKLFPRLKELKIEGSDAIKSNILGIMKIPYLELSKCDFTRSHVMEPFHIIAKHYGHSILECQEELIKNGYKEYAKL